MNMGITKVAEKKRKGLKGKRDLKKQRKCNFEKDLDEAKKMNKREIANVKIVVNTLHKGVVDGDGDLKMMTEA